MENLLEYLQHSKIDPNKLGVVSGNVCKKRKNSSINIELELEENEHGGLRKWLRLNYVKMEDIVVTDFNAYIEDRVTYTIEGRVKRADPGRRRKD